jgi:hypothetical protein
MTGIAAAPPPAPPPLDRHVPVEHRWMGLDRRTIPPALGVALLALVWAVLVPVIDRAVPEDRRVEAGQVYGAGNGVTVAPPTGWNVESGVPTSEGSPDRPAPDGVEVTSGGTTVRVLSVRWDGTLPELLDRVDEIHRDVDDGWQVTGGTGSLTTQDGVTGIGEDWRSGDRSGRVLAFLHDGVGVEVVVSSSFVERAAHREEIDDTVASITFTDGGGSGGGS